MDVYDFSSFLSLILTEDETGNQLFSYFCFVFSHRFD